jgi:hypothetical protein
MTQTWLRLCHPPFEDFIPEHQEHAAMLDLDSSEIKAISLSGSMVFMELYNLTLASKFGVKLERWLGREVMIVEW